jgi:putative transposase
MSAVTDATWRRIEALLARHAPPATVGRKRVPQRGVVEALAHKLTTGCPWNALPPELGDDATVHRTVQRWRRLGIYDTIAAILTAEHNAVERAS